MTASRNDRRFRNVAFRGENEPYVYDAGDRNIIKSAMHIVSKACTSVLDRLMRVVQISFCGDTMAKNNHYYYWTSGKLDCSLHLSPSLPICLFRWNARLFQLYYMLAFALCSRI